jgi:N-acyl-D-aspartate/D-glutamate deacylase/CubicO group peptidase (beta-lactamase class C family)
MNLPKFIGTLILLLSFTSAAAQWSKKIPTIDSALNYLHERQLLNGTVLIAEKGKPIYTKAFGIAGTNGLPLSTASAFNLASVSKQFYAMMIMMLKEEGKLQYDDAVQKHLPSFPYPNITIRNLLNQTSGLPEYFPLATRHRSLLDTLNNASMLALLADKKPPLSFNPGDKFEYCNTNYTTIGSIIEKISGMPCREFLQQRIAKPLGLKNTYIYQLGLKSYPPSRVFGIRYQKGMPAADDLTWMDGIVGDGNVYSSAEDLLVWDQALYTDKLVKKETFREAIQRVRLNGGDSSNYGFGWFIRAPGEEVDHTGGWVGFATYIDRHIASNTTIIILDNSGNARSWSIVKNILNNKPHTLPKTQLITNIQLLDGTGSKASRTNLRMVNDRISDTGQLKPFPGETVVDGKGLTLAPGFIDSHSHHEGGLEKDPSALACVSQGITTIVTGQDGGSDPMDSLSAQLKRNPVAVNVASYTGHASLRELVMKDLKRPATAEELGAMKVILQEELRKGSLGLSSGLEYEAGFFSSTDEMIELAKTTAAAGGRYMSHIRSEDVQLDAAIDEIIQIGMEAKLPVQLSHFKIAARSKWGSASGLLEKLQQARAMGINITADVYPYTMWSSTPRVLFPKKDFDNEASAEFAVKELFDPSASVLTRFPANKNYEGKTISAIAAMNKESDAKALMRVIRETNGGASIAGESMREDDVVTLMKWNYSNICSDGSYGGHPRGFGAFTRVLGYYVREQQIMPLETAVYKMTGLTAENLGLRNRGMIGQNYFADLVLFDPATVKDNSTLSDPHALSSGIEMVWINGELVYQKGKATAARPGKLVKR